MKNSIEIQTGRESDKAAFCGYLTIFCVVCTETLRFSVSLEDV
jgi:hypothetical protein